MTKNWSVIFENRLTQIILFIIFLQMAKSHVQREDWKKKTWIWNKIPPQPWISKNLIYKILNTTLLILQCLWRVCFEWLCHLYFGMHLLDRYNILYWKPRNSYYTHIYNRTREREETKKKTFANLITTNINTHVFSFWEYKCKSWGMELLVVTLCF